MADHGDTGDGLVGVHAHHHDDGALGTGGGDLHDVTGVGTGVLHAVQLGQLAALSGGSGGHIVADLQLIGEIAALGNDSAHSSAGIGRVDLGDLIGGHVVDQAQQGGDNQRDDRQSTGDLENKLTGDFHYLAASFFSFLTAP